MPISAALAFASALTLTIQFLIFAYLYSSHRVRFFQYLLTAWGLMSVAKGLHLAHYLVPGAEILNALINAAFFDPPHPGRRASFSLRLPDRAPRCADRRCRHAHRRHLR